MAFDGVPIGISDGLAEGCRFRLGRTRFSGWKTLRVSHFPQVNDDKLSLRKWT